MPALAENTPVALEETATATSPADMQETQTIVANPERPSSHPDIGSGEMSPEDAIKECTYLAGVALRNPTLARSMASATLESQKQESAMHQQGMGDQEIRSQQLAASRERFRAMAKARQTSPAEAAPAVEAVQTPEPAATTPASEVLKPFEPEIELLQEAIKPPLEVIVALQKTIDEPPVIAKELRASPVPRASKPVEQRVEVEAEAAPPLDPAPVRQPITKPTEKILEPAQPERPASLPPETETVITLSQETAEPIELPLDEVAATEQVMDLPPIVTEIQAEIVEEFPLTPPEATIETQHAPVIETVTEPKVFDEQEPPLKAAIEPLQDALPAVFIEQLDELPPQEQTAIAPVLQEITGVIQTITALKAETETIDQPALEEAVEQLETLVTVVAEQLDLSYSPETIEQFAAALIESGLPPEQLQQLLVHEVDLEKDGMHEAKLFQQHAAGTLAADVAQTITQFLGIFALRHITAANYVR
jgi:hypothetical protein